MSYPLDPEETIDSLSDRIGRWAQKKGFREDWEAGDDLEHWATFLETKDVGHMVAVSRLVEGEEQQSTLSDELRRIAKIVRNNVVMAKLMLIVSEIAEGAESWRDTGAEGHFAGEGNLMEELADSEIRVKDLAHLLGGGLGKIEMTKIKTNDGRPHKHGRKL